jgi:uncharacterized protein (DUF302 family)
MSDGLVSSRSAFGPQETMDRLVAAVTKRGMTVFARIDHAALAAQAGMALRPTEVLVFGNPRAGTPLMLAAQTTGIDLPLRALVWQDERGETRLAYNDPGWLVRRHGVSAEAVPSLQAMSDGLAAIGHEARSRVEGNA